MLFKVHTRAELAKFHGQVNISPTMFVENMMYMPHKGVLKPFSFAGRRYLKPIYNTNAARLLLQCGRQVEKTTTLGNMALTYLALISYFRILCVTPTEIQTATLSKDKIKTPLDLSPDLNAFEIKPTSVMEKNFITPSNIKFRYAFLHADRTRGISADLLMLDEIQDILTEIIPIIEEALSHSDYKILRYSGTPKSLDNTISYYWEKWSTQCEWVIPCDSCGTKAGFRHWNIAGEKNIGLLGLICDKCGKLINPDHDDAHWVSFNQAAVGVPTSFEGYRIPQLITSWVNWDEIVDKRNRYARRQFYNEVLGLGYDAGDRPLTLSEIRASCGQHTMFPPMPRASSSQYYLGIDWGCHDEETRILTESGFKYFRDLDDEDKVAQWDPDTREMTFVRPRVRTVRDWDQPLLHFETKGGLDLMVTHTHRMRTGASQGARWLTESAGETAERGGNVKFVGSVSWGGEERASFTLPGLPKSQGYSGSESATFSMDDWVELLGYLISEGGLCLDGDRPSCLKMSQRKTVNLETYQKIQDALDRMCIPFKAFPNEKTGDVNWTIYGKQFWKWYADNIGTSGATKRVPREFMALSSRQLRILWQALVDGDGTVDQRPNCTGGGYTSTSRGLCEDFQEICIKLGMRAVLRLHKPAAGNRKDQWRVSWSEGRDYQLNTPVSSVKRVPYSGKVYCCAVPSGYIVTERNGCISYQGNTGENTYTVLTLGRYVGTTFQVVLFQRLSGDDAEPERQLAIIEQLVQAYNVVRIGADYGGGFYMNNRLTTKLGVRRLVQYQYANLSEKIRYNSGLNRFIVSRTPVMMDIIAGIKRPGVFQFPRYTDIETPFATDMTAPYTEFNDSKNIIVVNKAPGTTDDTIHSLIYCFLASIIDHERPDILSPGT